jgi:hypothetical protein
MKVASEKYGTAVMKTEEVLLYVEAAVKGGAEIEEAFLDMQMIDSLLHMKKLHLSVMPHIRKTAKGHLRKGSDLYSALDCIVEARVNE